MRSTDIPSKFPIPWANSAGASFVRAIPVLSQVAIDPGFASLTDGFPPATATGIAAGGEPPNVQDFNGILRQMTAALRYMQAGGPVAYDSAFQSAIGGYPKGARIQGGNGTTIWLSTTENNTTNPDSAGAASWVDSAIADIGFTPVQQGGGIGQGPSPHKLLFGYDDAAGQPRLMVDATDQGHIIRASDVATFQPLIASRNVDLRGGGGAGITYTQATVFVAPCNGYADASAFLTTSTTAAGTSLANRVLFSGLGVTNNFNTGNVVGGPSTALACCTCASGTTVTATFTVAVSGNPLVQFQQDGIVRFMPGPT